MLRLSPEPDLTYVQLLENDGNLKSEPSLCPGKLSEQKCFRETQFQKNPCFVPIHFFIIIRRMWRFKKSYYICEHISICNDSYPYRPLSLLEAFILQMLFKGTV